MPIHKDFKTKLGEIEEIRTADQEIYTIRADECKRLYYGESLTPEQVQEYYARNKSFPATHNLITPKIRVLEGAQRQSRTDSKVSPTKRNPDDKTKFQSLILQSLIKDIDTKSSARELQAMEFHDLITTGRCARMAYVDTDLNPEGQLLWKDVSYKRVHPDPRSENPYFDDCEKVVVDTWMTAEEVERNFDLTPTAKANIKKIKKDVKLDYDYKRTLSNWVYRGREEDKKEMWKHLFLVTEYFYIEYKHQRYIHNSKEEMTEEFEGDEKEWQRLKLDAENTGFKEAYTFSKQKRIVMYAVVALGISEKNFIQEPKPYNVQPVYKEQVVLPIVMCRDGRHEDYYISRVWRLKHSQDIANRLLSSILEYISKGVKGVWKIERDAVVQNEDYIQRNIAKPGFVLWLKKNAGPGAVFEQASPMPSGLTELLGLFQNNLIDESGVTPSFMGQQESASESGRHLQLKLLQSFTSNKDLFDRYLGYLDKCAKVSMSMIPDTYTYQEMIRITTNEGDEKEVEINKLAWNAIENDIESYNLREFSVTVTQTQESPTQAQSLQQDILEAMGTVSGSPEASLLFLPSLMSTLDVPDKDEKVKMIQAFVDQQLGHLKVTQEQQALQGEAQLNNLIAGESEMNARTQQAQLANQQAQQMIQQGNLQEAVSA